MTKDAARSEPPHNPIERALASWQPAKALMAANRLDVFSVPLVRMRSMRVVLSQPAGTRCAVAMGPR